MSRLGKLGMIGGCMAISAALAGPALAEGLTIGGYVQSSYQYNFGKPRVLDTEATSPTFGENVVTGNQLRSFDAGQDDDFNLNQVQLNAVKPIGDDRFGYGLKLLFGRDADVLSGGDGVFLEEAYANYSPEKVKSLIVTGGKFVTAEGVEVIESPLNMNITEGFLFGLAEPFTHVGAKAAYAFNDKVTAMAGLVNGWDLDDDNNRGKTAIWQVATIPMEKTTLNFQGSYGAELTDQTHSKRTSIDMVAGYSGIDKVTLNFQANWGQDAEEDVTDDVWKGVGLWAGYSASDCLNPAIRFEIFDDQHGGSRSGTAQTVKGLTLTNKFKLTEKMFVRAEYRHDFSNVGAFQNSEGSTVRVQNTIGADWVVLF